MPKPEFLRELELTQEQFDALPPSVKKYLSQHDRSYTALGSLKSKPAKALDPEMERELKKIMEGFRRRAGIEEKPVAKKQDEQSVPRAARRPQTEWNASHINMMMTRFQSAMEMDKKLG